MDVFAWCRHPRPACNTECTCCRLIGASVHADSCTHGPRSKRRLNEGTVLFVLLVNSSQNRCAETPITTSPSQKINKYINKYKKKISWHWLPSYLATGSRFVERFCRRTAAKERFCSPKRYQIDGGWNQSVGWIDGTWLIKRGCFDNIHDKEMCIPRPENIRDGEDSAEMRPLPWDCSQGDSIKDCLLQKQWKHSIVGS